MGHAEFEMSGEYQEEMSRWQMSVSLMSKKEVVIRDPSMGNYCVILLLRK